MLKHKINKQKGMKIKPSLAANDITITNCSIQKLLENLNPYKSARPDGIKPNMLNELAIYIAPFLTIIFNIAFDTGTIPEKWKRQLSNQSTKRQQI